jgi:hypothetical protein
MGAPECAASICAASMIRPSPRCTAPGYHQGLLFGDLAPSDDDLIAFSKRFGPLDWASVEESGRRLVEGKPEF